MRFGVLGSCFRVRGLEGRGFGFVVSRLGLRVWLSRFPLRVFGVSGSGFQVRGFEYRVPGFGSRFSGS